jgi:plasmid stabilization system protein ParE
MSFRLTQRAEADLDEIDDYVVSEFDEAVIERLFETFELLADNPHIGRPRPEWASEDVLFFPVPELLR